MVEKFNDSYVHHVLSSAEHSISPQPSKLEGAEQTLFVNNCVHCMGTPEGLSEALTFVSPNFEHWWGKQQPKWLEILHFLKKFQEEVYNKQ